MALKVLAVVLFAIVLFALVACQGEQRIRVIEPTPTPELEVVNRHYDHEFGVVCYFIRTDLECIQLEDKR